ncbi:hypothetical protein B0A48_18061 [Cryoendolithus antarcticus]|uniref:Serine aminopeptidase S33 domain-containing protein n=1 Tax=Cryoendolithus antarcticus TaxID=1507870 RepID=A0A1V8SAI6_9PEZI|nr:hypothetical protein B0A48_18061 [Cryoendolithus antarcticus]
MSKITTQEGWHRFPDGFEAYTKTWVPQQSPPIAHYVFIHGYSDHINSYGGCAPALAENGIKVHSMDQRGWGRSVKTPAVRGRTGPTRKVLDDMTSFISSVLEESSRDGVPLFLMGHSMGGGQVLQYAAKGPPEILSRIRGFLAEAPLIQVHPDTKPWKLTEFAGRWAGKLMPHAHMVNKLDHTKLARDPNVGLQFKQDPLNHETGTLEGLAGMLDRANELDSGKILLQDSAGEGGKLRLWIAHGDADGVCDFEATKRFFERQKLADKEFRIYEGWYHVLHAEAGADERKFAEDVVEWVKARSGPLEGTKSRL